MGAVDHLSISRLSTHGLAVRGGAGEARVAVRLEVGQVAVELGAEVVVVGVAVAVARLAAAVALVMGTPRGVAAAATTIAASFGYAFGRAAWAAAGGGEAACAAAIAGAACVAAPSQLFRSSTVARGRRARQTRFASTEGRRGAGSPQSTLSISQRDIVGCGWEMASGGIVPA
jgi:type IV secretory pathway TrbD component